MKAKTKKLLTLGGIATGAYLLSRRVFSGSWGMGETETVANPNSTPSAGGTAATPSSLPAPAAAPAIAPAKKSMAKWLLPTAVLGAAYLFFRKK